MTRKHGATLVIARIHGLAYLGGGDLAIDQGPDLVLRRHYRLNDRAAV